MDLGMVDHLVVDSAAFLKHVKLERIGKHVYTIRSVIAEIRDEKTLERLQVLPYELIIREPKEDSVNKVIEFSKKVGDFASLSSTDLKVIALTYELHLEHCRDVEVPAEPVVSKTFLLTKKPTENAKDIAGFYLPNSDVKHVEEPVVSVSQLGEDLSAHSQIRDDNAAKHSEITANVEADTASCSGSDTESDSESYEDSSEEDDSGWITPTNFAKALGKMNAQELVEAVTVGCITTDFAMQNVILHMRMKVISLDGLRIRRLRSYVLRCIACFQITNVMSKKFCPRCGNETLKKVTITVDEEGATRFHLSTRKAFSTRGLRHSLPLPKGGKHAANPILVEDQPAAQNRLSRKALQKLNVFDDSYEARDSPFLMKDTNSRSAMLGIRTLGKSVSGNPNSWRQGKKRGGKKH